MEADFVEKEIVKVLMRVGIRNGGYEFFKRTLLIILIEDVTFFNITDVYNRTAMFYNKNFACVEHAMRTAIDRAYNFKTLLNINELFGQEVLFDKPSVSEFVTILTEYLRVFKNCKMG